MDKKIIRVEIKEKSPGLFFATSPDMRGLFDAKYSVEELEQSVPIVIRDLHAAAGVSVVVTSGEPSEVGFMNYIVTTADDDAKGKVTE